MPLKSLLVLILIPMILLISSPDRATNASMETATSLDIPVHLYGALI
jgi:hypothetical protein